MPSAGPVASLLSRPFARPPPAGWRSRCGSAWPTPLGSRPCGWPWKAIATDTSSIAAEVGFGGSGSRPAHPAEWGRYVSQVDDLPLEGLTSLHVRFDLVGPGEVWIDDVQVYHLSFSRAEMVELSKLITLADVKFAEPAGRRLSPSAGGLLAAISRRERALPSAAPSATAASKPQPAEEKPPNTPAGSAG